MAGAWGKGNPLSSSSSHGGSSASVASSTSSGWARLAAETRTTEQAMGQMRVSDRPTPARPPPSNDPNKTVVTNYLPFIKTTEDFKIWGYRVDFAPDVDSTSRKKALMQSHKDRLGPFVMDGHTLYAPREIRNENRVLKSVWKQDNTEYHITLRHVTNVDPDAKTVDQFYNVALKSILVKLGYETIGRNCYNRNDKIPIPKHRLELWPGVITAIREHEAGRLLCVELTHKVLRTETAYGIIMAEGRRLKERGFNDARIQDEISQALKDTIVMTHYNRRTYRVDKIRFDLSPKDLMPVRAGETKSMTYAQYYKDHWGIKETDIPLEQPLIEITPRRRDINKDVVDAIYLVPSLCYMTGLTDSQRKDFTLMKDLGQYLHMDPTSRKKHVEIFLAKLTKPEVLEELRLWNIAVSNELLRVEQVLMPNCVINLKNRATGGIEMVKPDAADWTQKLKRLTAVEKKNLKNWIVFHPMNDVPLADAKRMVKMLRELGSSLGLIIESEPVYESYDARRRFEEGAFNASVQKVRDLQLVFYVLPNNQLPRYSAVKSQVTSNLKCLSQCFLQKHLRQPDNKLRSVMEKVAIQLIAKLGGVPWTVQLPNFKPMMILGFDIYHCPDPRREGQTVGALVGTTNAELTKYVSLTKFHRDPRQLAENLKSMVQDCVREYFRNNNNKLPEHIVLFRDGVGEGQLDNVEKYEREQIDKGIVEVYRSLGGNEQPLPKFAFIIVTKKINTRYVLEGADRIWKNPVPGTVVDRDIIVPGKTEFFMISQTVRQGTVSPTNYNIIHNSSYPKDKMERLSYIMCHLYYNWSGTVAVPAPCQYAHKLAFLSAMSLATDEIPDNLRQRLWYL